MVCNASFKLFYAFFYAVRQILCPSPDSENFLTTLLKISSTLKLFKLSEVEVLIIL